MQTKIKEERFGISKNNFEELKQFLLSHLKIKQFIEGWDSVIIHTLYLNTKVEELSRDYSVRLRTYTHDTEIPHLFDITSHSPCVLEIKYGQKGTLITKQRETFLTTKSLLDTLAHETLVEEDLIRLRTNNVPYPYPKDRLDRDGLRSLLVSIQNQSLVPWIGTIYRRSYLIPNQPSCIFRLTLDGDTRYYAFSNGNPYLLSSEPNCIVEVKSFSQQHTDKLTAKINHALHKFGSSRIISKRQSAINSMSKLKCARARNTHTFLK